MANLTNYCLTQMQLDSLPPMTHERGHEQLTAVSVIEMKCYIKQILSFQN